MDSCGVIQGIQRTEQRTGRQDLRGGWSHRESLVISTQRTPLELSTVDFSRGFQRSITFIGHIFLARGNGVPKWGRLAAGVHLLGPQNEVASNTVNSIPVLTALSLRSLSEIFGN